MILTLIGVSGGFVLVSLAGASLIDRAHPARGSFIEVEGTRLHVVDLPARHPAGADAPAILIIHGASSNAEDMRLALGERLCERHRVIIIDRPGLGWSKRSDRATASPARQAALLALALDQLGVSRAVVVGHSLGGAVATAFALDAPERVAGLVLLAPVAYPWQGRVAWYYDVAQVPVLGQVFAAMLGVPIGMALLGALTREVFAPQTPPPGYVTAAAIRLVLRPQTFMNNARDIAVLKAFVAAQAPHYSRISAPTVIITGDSDATVAPEIHAAVLAEAIPQARLEILPGVGHMPHYAAPERVLAAIDGIIDADAGATVPVAAAGAAGLAAGAPAEDRRLTVAV